MRSLSTKYRKELLDTATEPWLDILKTTSKKVSHKVAEVTGKFIGKKVAEKNVKLKPIPGVNSRNVEKIIILPEKRQEILN